MTRNRDTTTPLARSLARIVVGRGEEHPGRATSSGEDHADAPDCRPEPRTAEDAASRGCWPDPPPNSGCW